MRIIGIDVPGFGVPTHAEAKDVLAGAMLHYARDEAEQGPVQAPRGGADRQADRHAARRDVPGRSRRHRRACSSRWASPPGRSCRRASGASSTPRSTAPPSPRSIPSTPPPCASSRRRAARSSAPRRSATTAPPPGSRPSARPAASRGDKIDAAKNAFLPAITGALADDADQRPDHAVRLRGLGAAGRAPAGRERRRRPLRRHRLPEDAIGRTPTASGSRRGRAASVPRLARAGPGRDRGVPARPRHRHDAGRAEGQGSRRSRRSTSPT